MRVGYCLPEAERTAYYSAEDDRRTCVLRDEKAAFAVFTDARLRLDADVVERILRHLKIWNPIPDPIILSDPDPPWPKDQTLPFTYDPVPDIA